MHNCLNTAVCEILEPEAACGIGYSRLAAMLVGLVIHKMAEIEQWRCPKRGDSPRKDFDDLGAHGNIDTITGLVYVRTDGMTLMDN